jgi:DNA mismatch repair protein MutL
VNIKDLYGGDAVPAPTGEIHEQEDSAYVPGAATEHPQQPSSETVRTASSGDSPDQQELRIDYLQVLGSVFGSYILAADEDSLYLVDWHAAHERVNYEKLMEGYRSGEKLSQALLTPEVLNLPATARQYTDDWAVWLTAAGFGAEVFGENALIVKSVPAFIGAGEALRFVNDIIESGGNSPPVGDQAVERLISRACRSSVKANAHIREEEARALLQRLAECANPYTCPHGRPVFIRYTKYDLEKLFKRT